MRVLVVVIAQILGQRQSPAPDAHTRPIGMTVSQANNEGTTIHHEIEESLERKDSDLQKQEDEEGLVRNGLVHAVDGSKGVGKVKYDHFKKRLDMNDWKKLLGAYRRKWPAWQLVWCACEPPKPKRCFRLVGCSIVRAKYGCCC